MFNIAIVEDQEETRESLNRFVRQYAQEQGLQVEISLITDGAEIAEHYTPGFDIIFMDVEMPRLDGFGAAEAIRAVDADVVLVFVTNMGTVCHPGLRGRCTGLCAEAGELLSVLHQAFPRHPAGAAAQRRAGGAAAGGRRHPAAGHR